jgi:PAS domain S-box-containing protein
LAVPGCQGIPSLRRLILAATSAPVVIVSSAYDEAQAFEAVRAGAEDYTVSSRMNTAAFERVILYAIERHMARQRTALQFSVSRMLAESATLRNAASGILGALCDFAKCDSGEVWKTDALQDRLVLVDCWPAPPDSLSETDCSVSRTASRGQGLLGTVWASSSPAWLPEHPNGADQSAGIEAAVALPLNVGTGTLGVLALFGPGATSRDEDFIKLLTSVAGQLGQFMARKSAEEDRESLGAERLIILDSMSEGIYGLDRHANITFMNKSAARILGCNLEQVLGKNAHTLFHHTRPDGSAYAESECPVARLMVTGENHRSDQDYFWRLDGSHFAVDYSARPVFKNNSINGAVISFTDISDKRQMEVELRHGQKLEAVGRLAAGIAHEINTPIQFIGDNTRFLQDSFRDTLEMIAKYEQIYDEAAKGSPNPGPIRELDAIRQKIEWSYLRVEIPKAMEQALDGVNRVATIVRAMKEFSHVDRSAEKTAADLNKALESTLIVARNEVKYVADVQTDFGPLPPVICHLGDLNQVFLNLLVNAAHAIAEAAGPNGEKGLITLRTTCDDEFVTVSIQDSGTGIPEAVRGKVFDPFFTTKEVGKGTGQGLALARAVVVDKHGGTLTFETQMGKGTTFFVRLPISGIPVTREAVPA